MTAQRDSTVKLWPAALSPNRVQAIIDRPALTGAPVLSGRPQTIVSTAGSWRIRYGEVAFTGRRYRQFRALLAALKGGLKPIYVSPFDFYHAPYVLAGLTRPTLRSFTGAGTWTFTGPYYLAESTYDCVLAASCSAGATQISVTNSSVAPLVAGDYFELGGRLHLLEEIDGTTWTIWPPTRAAYASGDKIEIDDPRCLCYLDPNSDGADPDVQFGQLGYGSFDFIEARW
jgi:hypothetical protein